MTRGSMAFYNPQLYSHARANCAALDLTQTRASLLVTGEDRFSWLQGMVSSDVERLKRDHQQSIPAFILDPTGHPLADFTITAFNSNNEFSPDGSPCIVISLPSETENAITALLESYIIMEDVTLSSISHECQQISLMGPAAHTVQLSPFLSLNNTKRDAYLEFLIPQTSIDHFRKLLEENRIPFLDTETAELLRIEDGLPMWGKEISPKVLAPEVDPNNIRSSTTKGCYVGQEIIARIASRGHTNRQLTGLIFENVSCPNFEAAILDSDDREVGWVTSATPISPAMQDQAIGLGFIRHEIVTNNDRVHLADSNVKLHPLPFYKP